MRQLRHHTLPSTVKFSLPPSGRSSSSAGMLCIAKLVQLLQKLNTCKAQSHSKVFQAAEVYAHCLVIATSVGPLSTPFWEHALSNDTLTYPPKTRKFSSAQFSPAAACMRALVPRWDLAPAPYPLYSTAPSRPHDICAGQAAALAHESSNSRSQGWSAQPGWLFAEASSASLAKRETRHSRQPVLPRRTRSLDCPNWHRHTNRLLVWRCVLLATAHSHAGD